MKKAFLASMLASITFAAAAQNIPTNNNADDTRPVVPVLKTYVPPDIVAKAIKKYGRILYCISQATSVNGEQGYIVGLIRNGRLTNEWMEDLKIAIINVRDPFSDI